jgi:hypothetical protein
MSLTTEVNLWPLATKVLLWTFALIVLVTAVYGYLQVELNTITQGQNLDIQTKCQDQGNQLKQAKVFEYHPYRDYASILCVFQDSSENTLIILNYRQDWEVVTREKINQSRDFYWPIYL